MSPEGNILIIGVDNGVIEMFDIDNQSNFKFENKGELLRHISVDYN